MNLYIQPETSALADAISASARRVSTALSGVGMTTEIALDRADADLIDLIADAKLARMAIRGIRVSARRKAA